MQKIIEELKLADATLDSDGYKTWSSVRLAIAQAMDLLQKQLLQQTPVSGQSELLLDFLQWFDKPQQLIDHNQLIREYEAEKYSNSR